MRYRVAVLLCLGGWLTTALSSHASAADPPAKPPTAEQLAMWLQAEEKEEFEKLAAMSERLFPALQEITGGTVYPAGTVARAFVLLQMMKGDRSRFLDRAVVHLGDKSKSLRLEAIGFLGSTGEEAEATPLAVLLLDQATEVRFAAAEAIAAIGGKRQLAVFDLILKNAKRYDQDGKLILDQIDIEHFEKCRAKLEERLKKKEMELKAKAAEKKEEKK